MSAQQLNKAGRQLASVDEDLQRVASMLAMPEGIDWQGATALVSGASAGLATASLTLRTIEETVSRETSVEKRKEGKEKLKEHWAHHQTLKERIDRYKGQAKEAERQSSRTGLFSPATSSPQMATTAASSQVEITKEALAEREERVLGYTETRLGEYISLGSSTLDSLRSQRSLLKGAQRRVLDAGTSLGLSQSLMRIIHRRTTQDRYIFYAGLAAILLVIYLCWKYIV